MAEPTSASAAGGGSQPRPQPIVIRQEGPPRRRNWLAWLLLAALMTSVLFNLGLLVQYQEYFATSSPMERYHSGAKEAGVDKIAVIRVDGMIMPPYTDRILRAIKKAKEDERVRGVVLTVDSPGGLVADSHMIFHKLQELSRDKPVAVAMQRMAASGGYYIAMGAGPEAKVYAEPTTWTGSIGVIIPRYNAKELAEKVGLNSEPLMTGEFKDALSPFRDLSEAEAQVWQEILDDAFQRFLQVIADNRAELDIDAVRKLATGQVYTATQAKQNHLIDEIGYEDDAIEHMKQHLGIESLRVVTYQFPPTVLDVLTGGVEAPEPQTHWQDLLEASVPKAMYLCSWGLGVPGW
jgi:protease-4